MAARQDRSMMMRARFGEAWNAYCARTGQLFPRQAS